MNPVTWLLSAVTVLAGCALAILLERCIDELFGQHGELDDIN
jgi:hypothetical protein